MQSSLNLNTFLFFRKSQPFLQQPRCFFERGPLLDIIWQQESSRENERSRFVVVGSNVVLLSHTSSTTSYTTLPKLSFMYNPRTILCTRTVMLKKNAVKNNSLPCTTCSGLHFTYHCPPRHPPSPHQIPSYIPYKRT